MNSLTISDAIVPGLYGRMQTAIAQCYDLDDCKVIADQASAISAYFKQIKDDESMRKFLAVKLRAWRRIGDICAQVDKTDCAGQSEYYAKIHSFFPEITTAQAAQAIKLAAVPLDFFDRVIPHSKSMTDVLSSYSVWTSDGKTVHERSRQRQAENQHALNRARETGKADFEEGLSSIHTVIPEVYHAYQEAHSEVGYTMDRRDRRRMKTVVLLLTAEKHAILRQAAFDNKMTMQEILRQGMSLWFKSRGVAE